MARPVRIDVEGGWYHVTARGIERRPIFLGEAYGRHFYELLGEMTERYALGVHAYVLMGNHYHLLIQTPQANASRALQWLNVSYSAWFNRKQERVGHVFQGRFKSVLIDGNGSWLLDASAYVHLNPVRLQTLGLGQHRRRVEARGLRPPAKETIRQRLAVLRKTPWNSYRDYVGYAKPPDWLTRGEILSRAGGEKAYRRYVESFITRGFEPELCNELKTQVIFGSRAFEDRMKKRAGRLTKEQPDRKQVLRVVTFDQIVRAVEDVKGEKWDAFRDRYGDWGRDLVLYLARRRSGLTLREIGEKAGGIEYKTVSRAVVCFGERLRNHRKLARLVARLLEDL
jgi:REP element-mobilizing transposase RayT